MDYKSILLCVQNSVNNTYNFSVLYYKLINASERWNWIFVWLIDFVFFASVQQLVRGVAELLPPDFLKFAAASQFPAERPPIPYQPGQLLVLTWKKLDYSLDSAAKVHLKRGFEDIECK